MRTRRRKTRARAARIDVVVALSHFDCDDRSQVCARQRACESAAAGSPFFQAPGRAYASFWALGERDFRAMRVITTATVATLLYIYWQRRRRRSTKIIPGYNQTVELHRQTELPSLSRCVYLDYSGAALPTTSQLRAAAAQLAAAAPILGNPHSDGGPAAAAAAGAMETARRLLLEHFCGSCAHEWELIFTSGATAALRLAAEAFPFSRGRSAFVHTQSAHTSVLGMRSPATDGRHTCTAEARPTRCGGSRRGARRTWSGRSGACRSSATSSTTRAGRSRARSPP